MYEAELRDLLSENIQILEKGLTLLNKEQYIPNNLGTRGFIDLYARDAQGHHVLIELKRSEAASREALHEIHKYIEGVKSHFGARDQEIRVIVASTEWRELLVPFSQFVAKTDINILGLELEINESKEIKATTPALVDFQQGRYIAPWHEANWYTNEKSLQAGLQSIKTVCEKKGIRDYIIIVLESSTPIHSQRQAQMRGMLTGLLSDDLTSSSPLPLYQYIAYFAMQILRDDACLEVLKCNPHLLRQTLEETEGMNGEELSGALHEAVSAMDPRPESDFYEIGTPAKFSAFQDDHGFSISSVIRSGSFSRNKLLSDEEIVNEIHALDGITGHRFSKSIDISNHAHLSALRSQISSCLTHNPVWKRQILTMLDEVSQDFPNSTIDLHIYNPSTGVFTLLFPLVFEKGERYIPNFSLSVHTEEAVRIYTGGLQCEGIPIDYDALLDKYYSGTTEALFLSMTWGGNDPRDTEILEDLGFRYRCFRYDKNKTNETFFTFRDERWRAHEIIGIYDLFTDYYEKNGPTIQKLMRKIGSKLTGAGSVIIRGDSALAQYIDISMGRKRNQFFHGAPTHCESCECSFSKEKYMIDGKIKGYRGWACMCEDCFLIEGEGIGLGIGQIYLNDADGWLMVGGLPPDFGTC